MAPKIRLRRSGYRSLSVSSTASASRRLEVRSRGQVLSTTGRERAAAIAKKAEELAEAQRKAAEEAAAANAAEEAGEQEA